MKKITMINICTLLIILFSVTVIANTAFTEEAKQKGYHETLYVDAIESATNSNIITVTSRLIAKNITSQSRMTSPEFCIGTSCVTTWLQVAEMGPSPLWIETAGNIYRPTGNVGIGTSNPSYKLHVIGTGIITSNTYLATDSGRVGIGTTTPSYKLDVSGDARTTDNTYLATDAGRVGIGTASPGYNLDVSGTARTTQSTYLATSSGNVGIGTTNPQAKLHIVGGLRIDTTLTGSYLPIIVNGNTKYVKLYDSPFYTLTITHTGKGNPAFMDLRSMYSTPNTGTYEQDEGDIINLAPTLGTKRLKIDSWTINGLTTALSSISTTIYTDTTATATFSCTSYFENTLDLNNGCKNNYGCCTNLVNCPPSLQGTCVYSDCQEVAQTSNYYPECYRCKHDSTKITAEPMTGGECDMFYVPDALCRSEYARCQDGKYVCMFLPDVNYCDCLLHRQPGEVCNRV